MGSPQSQSRPDVVRAKGPLGEMQLSYRIRSDETARPMPAPVKASSQERKQASPAWRACFNRVGFWPVCQFRVRAPAKQSSVAGFDCSVVCGSRRQCWAEVRQGIREESMSPPFCILMVKVSTRT